MKRPDASPPPRQQPRHARRDVPYRPPREEYDTAGAFSLAVMFFRRYLVPVRWRLATYIAVATVNACSVYLMSYYAKVVVDDILVVNAAPAAHEPARAASPAIQAGVLPRRRFISAAMRSGPSTPSIKRFTVRSV